MLSALALVVASLSVAHGGDITLRGSESKIIFEEGGELQFKGDGELRFKGDDSRIVFEQSDGEEFVLDLAAMKALVGDSTLAFALCTTSGQSQTYDAAFWSGTEVNPTADPLTQCVDVMRSAYSTAMGSRIKLVGYISGQIVATAMYNVKANFQSSSLKDVMYSNNNQVFAEKDAAGSTAGTPILSSYLVNANGNQGQQIYDPFFDTNYDLKGNAQSWGGACVNKFRLSTEVSWSGGHVYQGIGGQHRHGCNDWGIDF